jgi:hypothetical protein
MNEALRLLHRLEELRSKLQSAQRQRIRAEREALDDLKFRLDVQISRIRGQLLDLKG